MAEAARDADAVVVSDYGAGVVGDEVREVLRQLAADGLPVCVDSRYACASFSGLTVCKPNEPELEALAGRPVRTEDGPGWRRGTRRCASAARAARCW